MKNKLNAVITILLFLSTIVFSQQKTGNIVEYFGKEKVNEVKEGDVIHVFKKGLTLKVQNFEFNSSSFPKDLVFNEFLMNSELRVTNGDVFGINSYGEELIWNGIKADDTNSLSDPSLRSSYVYLEYKSTASKTVLFEASGHSLLTINGLPHEGDHYDFGWNLIPVTLKKGTNIFVLKVGRFPKIRARIIKATAPIQFTSRDLTLPDCLNILRLPIR